MNVVFSLSEQNYLVHDRNHTLQYMIDIRKIVFKDEEVTLISINCSNAMEKTHAKVTENKYSQLIISTITHDLKSPITAIQGHLSILEQFVAEKGLKYLKAAQVSSVAFEYYIYDLVVKAKFQHRILIKLWKEHSL